MHPFSILTQQTSTGVRQPNVTNCHQFWWGLQEEVKEELALVGLPSGFDAFVVLATFVACCLQEWREKKQWSLNSPVPFTVVVTPKPSEIDMGHCWLTPDKWEWHHQLNLFITVRTQTHPMPQKRDQGKWATPRLGKGVSLESPQTPFTHSVTNSQLSRFRILTYSYSSISKSQVRSVCSHS